MMKNADPSVIAKDGDSSVGKEKLEKLYNQYVNDLLSKGYQLSSPDVMSFDDYCTQYLQNWWNEQSRPSQTKPEPVPRRKAEDMSKYEAAIIIQKSWRRHIDVQVYCYYRDLINFRSRGDPMIMLRCINPNEAKLLDPAFGIHIKFRLAGEKFPPNIYYKIFTHRPVQDLCANSPKDYTAASSKQSVARDIHNKGKILKSQDKCGWYQRTENNGWRLVSDRLINTLTSDPVTWQTSQKKTEFHHDRLQRKTDVERKKKQKKITWMKKLYMNGMLKAKVEDKDTVQLINGAAAGMIATIDKHGINAVQDWEVDELLDWTISLNFDEYWCEWKEIATSGCSDKDIVNRLEYRSTAQDPFEIRVSVNNQRDGSTRQSHNTPASSPALSHIQH